jgi:hypothetical protein
LILQKETESPWSIPGPAPGDENSGTNQPSSQTNQDEWHHHPGKPYQLYNKEPIIIIIIIIKQWLL